jgi:hypothetical protein
MGGGGVKKREILNLKTHTSLATKDGCGFTHMYVQINNHSKNVYIFKPILLL